MSYLNDKTIRKHLDLIISVETKLFIVTKILKQLLRRALALFYVFKRYERHTIFPTFSPISVWSLAGSISRSGFRAQASIILWYEE